MSAKNRRSRLLGWGRNAKNNRRNRSRRSQRSRRWASFEALEPRQLLAAVVESGVEFRVTEGGNATAGDDDDEGEHPSIVYNSTDNEYLVAFVDNVGNGTRSIKGQRFNAATGAESGSEFMIGDAGDADDVAVAWDSVNNQYLAVWVRDTGTPSFIDGQLFGNTGTEIGTDFTISEGATGVDEYPDIVFNATDQEYLVVYEAGSSATDQQVVGRFVTTAGAVSGSEFAIGNGGSDRTENPAVAWNSTDNEYMVAFDTRTSATNIHIQRLDNNGVSLATGGEASATTDHKISDLLNPSTHDANDARIAYNSTNNEYYVVFLSDSNPSATAEHDLFAQLIDDDGNEIEGTTDVRITNPPNNARDLLSGGFANHDVVFDSGANEYLVIFAADFGTNDNANEPYIEKRDQDGAQVGDSDIRIQTLGSADDIRTPRLAYNTTNKNFLAVWEGDKVEGNYADGEDELWGQLLVPLVTNADPTITVGNLIYTEDQNGGNPVQIDGSATANDTDGDADWNAGTLTVQITANAEATDEISIPDNIVGTINTSGTNLRNVATVIGTLSASEGTVTGGATLTITFNGSVTNALVQQVVRAISYRTTSDTPSTSARTVTFTVTDANSGSGNDTSTISVASVADPPTVTSPASATTVNAANFSVTGTSEANGLVKVYSDADNNGMINGPDTVVGSQQLSGGATSFSISAGLTPNADNNFTVTVTDAGSDESDPVNVPTITEDSAAPTVTIEEGATQDDPTNTLPIVFDVSFSEVVSGFDENDVSLGGSAVLNTPVITVTDTGDSQNFTVSVNATSVTTNGALIATVNANAATDAASNNSAASTSNDNSVTFVTLETEVTLATGVLTITDINGGTSNDNLTISYTGDKYTITDTGGLIITTAIAATGDLSATVTIPDTGVTSIVFDTLAGGDTVTVSSVQASLTGGFTINGGADADSAAINGSVSTSGGNINLSVETLTTSQALSAGGGNITATVDNLTLGAALSGSGALLIKPHTASATIGLGDGTGTLNLDDTELGFLQDGFSSITIGDTTSGTGTVDIDTATFTDPVTIAGGTINDGAGTDIAAGTNTVTLDGNVSPGQSPGVLTVSGDVDLVDSFTVEIDGTAGAGNASGHDQLSASGSVDIVGTVALTPTGSPTLAVGNSFTIISRTGGTGIFDGLGEGEVISTNFLGSGLAARISYTGGGGDDVVINVVGSDFGDAPDSYSTLDASGGPKHLITGSLFLGGAAPDADSDGFGDGTEDNPNPASDDDTEGTAPDDENGVTSFDLLFLAATTYNVNVTLSNTTGGNANLIGWIDFDGNGTFEADEAATVVVADSATTATLTWNDIGTTGPDIVVGDSFTRLRLTTDASVTTATPGGAASDGEVEDYALPIVASSLVGHWKLDETSGIVAEDAAGGDHNATLIDSAVFVNDASRGQVLLLSGTHGRAVLDNALDLGSQWTISAWFKDLAASGSFRTLARGEAADHQIIVDPTGLLGSFDNAGGTGFHGSGFNMNSLSADWHQIAAVGSGGSTTFFIDGAQVGTTVGFQSTTDVKGLGNHFAGTQRFANLLDEVRIYGEALDAGDVADLAAAGSLVGHWKLDETSGSTAEDAAGGDHNATLLGAGFVNDVSRGQVLLLSGTHGRAVLDTALDLGNQWTISAWFKDLAAAGSFRTLTRGEVSDHQIIVDPTGLLGSFDNAGGTGFHSSGFNMNSLSADWHQIAAVGSGGSTTFFIDGAQVGTTVGFQSTTDVKGLGNHFAGTQRFANLLDEVRIFDQALSASQVAGLAGQDGYWRFDETSGNVAQDSAGGDHDATLFGAAFFNDASRGQVLSLSGTHGRAVVDTAVDLASEWTIAAWFKDLAAAGSFRTLARGEAGDHQIIVDPTGQLGSFDNVTGSGFNSSGFDMNSLSAAWHHIAAVGSGGLTTFFIDGAQVGTTIGFQSTTDVKGLGNHFAGTQRFSSFLDEARVFNQALSASQVADLAGASPLLAAGGGYSQESRVESLEPEDVNLIVDAAITRLAGSGLSREQLATLSSVTFAIADLPGARLGQQVGNTITLDINAAGYGWFVSPESRDKRLEPVDSDAYSGSGLSTLDSRLHIDLLTVIYHEMGHAIGLDDDYSDPDSHDIMNGWLSTGTRRLPSVEAIDLVLADQHLWDDEFTS